MTRRTSHRLLITTSLGVLMAAGGCHVSTKTADPAAPSEEMNWIEAIDYSKSLIGSPAPDFTVKAIRQGEPDFTLSEAAANGDAVVLAFWIRACEACTREMPSLGKLVEWSEENDLPVSVVTVHNNTGWYTPNSKSKRPSEEEIAKFNDALKFYVEGQEDDFTSVYGVRSWPRIYVIDAQGTITFVKANSGVDLFAELKVAVEEALEG
jgi:peroxiredoxin